MIGFVKLLILIVFAIVFYLLIGCAKLVASASNYVIGSRRETISKEYETGYSNNQKIDILRIKNLYTECKNIINSYYPFPYTKNSIDEVILTSELLFIVFFGLIDSARFYKMNRTGIMLISHLKDFIINEIYCNIKQYCDCVLPEVEAAYRHRENCYLTIKTLEAFQPFSPDNDILLIQIKGHCSIIRVSFEVDKMVMSNQSFPLSDEISTEKYVAGKYKGHTEEETNQDIKALESFCNETLAIIMEIYKIIEEKSKKEIC